MDDMILFAENKEPQADVQEGEDATRMLRTCCLRHLQRWIPAHGMRRDVVFLGNPCKWHEEQCTLVEF